MKPVTLILSIDKETCNTDPNLLAYNIAKNVEMAFNVNVEYSLVPIGNSYRIISEDKYLEISISKFIESNWNF